MTENIPIYKFVGGRDDRVCPQCNGRNWKMWYGWSDVYMIYFCMDCNFKWEEQYYYGRED